MSRLETLKQIVEQNPADAFARYGLGMEYATAGEYSEAARQFEAILGGQPEYVAAYYQAGQALERLGRVRDAKELYRRGIDVTTRLGDSHACEQLQAAFDQLG